MSATQQTSLAKRIHQGMRVVPEKHGFRQLDKDSRIRRPVVGLGAGTKDQIVARFNPKAAEDPRAGLGSIVDMILESKNCPMYNMDNTEQVRWGMLGPQTDASIKANFGATIDLFGSGKSVAGIDFVESTMAQPGQTQTYEVICYIFLHLEPEEFVCTIPGNAWTHPTTGAVQPPSPDVFTQLDRFNGALGAAFAGATPTQVIIPAVLEWGWWWQQAFWHLVRGYNLRWKLGNKTNIMDEVARHTAYMPTNAQEGSASSSEVDVIDLVRRTNDYYESIGSALDFLKVNRIRTGSVGAGAANFGLFRPSRDEERVGVTFGGGDLRKLLEGHSECRRLPVPYVVKPGVPVGLFLQENDQDQGDLMRRYLSATMSDISGGSIPPLVTDAGNIEAAPDGTGAGNVALERTVDNANQPQQVDAERAVYKGGVGKISLGFKGFEITDDMYEAMASSSDIANLLSTQCGINVVKW